MNIFGWRSYLAMLSGVWERYNHPHVGVGINAFRKFGKCLSSVVQTLSVFISALTVGTMHHPLLLSLLFRVLLPSRMEV